MTTLRRERLPGRRRLLEMELAAGQARVARELESAYLEAASRLEQTDAPAGAPTLYDIVGSMRATAGAYGQLEDAAADLNEARYQAASEAVIAGEKAVEEEAAMAGAA
jgi:hypothetical protein